MYGYRSGQNDVYTVRIVILIEQCGVDMNMLLPLKPLFTLLCLNVEKPKKEILIVYCPVLFKNLKTINNNQGGRVVVVSCSRKFVRKYIVSDSVIRTDDCALVDSYWNMCIVSV